jgi:hypothetical protein
MKKIFVLIVVASMASSAVVGQDFKKYKIAFRLSPNLSWMVPQTQDLHQDGTSVRFGFGANVDIHFTENYAIGTGLGIDQSGGSLTYFQHVTRLDADDKEVNYIINKQREYQLQYVEVPITLKLRTNEIGYITYWGQFGFGLGVNYRAKADDVDQFLREYNKDDQLWEVSERVDDKNQQVVVKKDIITPRVSLIIAGGIEYNVSGSTSIIVGLTFDNGFTNTLKGDGVEEKSEGIPLISPEGPVTYDLKAYSNFLALTVGLLF